MVESTPGVNGPTVPQQGPPQWDGDALVVEGTHYVEAEWRTVTVIESWLPRNRSLKTATGGLWTQSTYRDDPAES